jgi:hypothetical protein
MNWDRYKKKKKDSCSNKNKDRYKERKKWAQEQE